MLRTVIALSIDHDEIHGSSTTNIYAEVTARVVSAIEAGAGEYRFSWHSAAALLTNVMTGKAYRGMDAVLLCWTHAQQPPES